MIHEERPAFVFADGDVTNGSTVVGHVVGVASNGSIEVQVGPRTPADMIAEACDALKALLLEKNRAYGNSALDPLRVFSRASPVEQLLVRIDDKLSRLKRGVVLADGGVAGEDVVQDLAGYLVLLMVARKSAPAP